MRRYVAYCHPKLVELYRLVGAKDVGLRVQRARTQRAAPDRGRRPTRTRCASAPRSWASWSIAAEERMKPFALFARIRPAPPPSRGGCSYASPSRSRRESSARRGCASTCRSDRPSPASATELAEDRRARTRLRSGRLPRSRRHRRRRRRLGPRALAQVATLAERLRESRRCIEVRDPRSVPVLRPPREPAAARARRALSPPGMSLDSPAARRLIEDLLRTPSARRLVVGDDDQPSGGDRVDRHPQRGLRAPSRGGRARSAPWCASWSAETGIATQVTGYPEVEQVYAEEVLSSVLRSIALLAGDDGRDPVRLLPALDRRRHLSRRRDSRRCRSCWAS